MPDINFNYTPIEDTTSINGFQDTYNTDRSNIQSCLYSLQKQINTLQSNFNTYKTQCQSKFKSLEDEIKNSLPEFNDEIQEKFNEIYNIIYK